MLEYLETFPNQEVGRRRHWTGNRVLHDIEKMLVRNAPYDLNNHEDGYILRDFCSGVTSTNLQNHLKEIALSTGHVHETVKQNLETDVEAITQLVSPRLSKHSAIDRYEDPAKRSLDLNGSKVSINGLKILRFLNGEWRKPRNVGDTE